MIFTKAKIGLFLVAVLVLGWLLYPRAVFLGYIYEGKSKLVDAEKYYQDYLKTNPYNKFATFRLASLYEKIGDPGKASLYLERLFDYRKKDWEVTEKYLSHLEDLGDGEKLFKARLEIVKRFGEDPLFPKGRLEVLLYDALQYARWTQKEDQVVSILESLIVMGRNVENYREELELLKASQHDDARIFKNYKDKLQSNPQDRNIREDLIAVCQVLGKWDEAITLVNEALRTDPFDARWLALRLEFYQRQKKWDLVEMDVRLLLSQLSTTGSEEGQMKRILYTELLADLLKKQKKNEEALQVYQRLLEENPSRRESWLNVIYYFSEHKSQSELKNILALYVKKFPEDLERQRLYQEFLFYDVSGEAALQIGREMLQKDPRNESVILRMAYLSADQKDFQSSKRDFELYARQHLRDPQALLLTGKELYFMGFYEDAEKYLRDAVKRRGHSEERHWLAENQWNLAMHYKKSGFWKKTMESLKELKAEDVTSVKLEDIRYEKFLLHKRYDDRVSSRFEISHISQDTWTLWTESYSKYITEHWHLLSDLQYGHYDTPAGDQLLKSHTQFINEHQNWKWGAGLGVGVSGERKTASPSFVIGYGQKEHAAIEVEGSYRDLRQDLSSFVGAGALKDQVKLSWESLWHERLIVSGHYEWMQTTLNSGAKAQEHHFEPSVALIVWRKPYLTFGYQFSFEQVHDQGLLATIPLIPEIRTHYLTTLIHVPVSRMNTGSFVEFGAYIGEDPHRNLHLFKGDLFGLRAQAEWAILPWLDLGLEYHFGRQTQSSLAGESHRGIINASVHW